MDDCTVKLLIIGAFFLLAYKLIKSTTQQWHVVSMTVELECSACRHRVTLHKRSTRCAAPVRCPVCGRTSKLRSLNELLDIVE